MRTPQAGAQGSAGALACSLDDSFAAGEAPALRSTSEDPLGRIADDSFARGRIDARAVERVRELAHRPLYRSCRVIGADHHLPRADETEQELKSGRRHEHRIVIEALHVVRRKLPFLAELAIE